MKKGYSNYQPLYKLIILYIITFGVYTLVWIYRTSKQLKEANFNVNFCKKNKEEEMSGKISPPLRTIGLFIPIVNIIVLYETFKAIISYAELNKKGDYKSPGFFIMFYLFLMAMWLGFIPIAMIQSTLNKTWKKTDKRTIKKMPYIHEWLIFILVPFLIFSIITAAYIEPTNFLPEESLEEQIKPYCEEACLEKEDLKSSYVRVNPNNQSQYICNCLDSKGYIIVRYIFEL